MDDDMDLGWRLYLDDEMSAVLDRVSGAWRQTVDGVNSGGTRVIQVFAQVEDRVRAAGASFVSWASRGVNTFGRGVAALLGESGTLGMLLGGPVGLATMMHRVVRSSMEAGGEIEQLQLAFTTLMHSADGARAHLDALQQFAVGKPFEFSYLATASRTLQSFGYSARDTMGMLRDFGDVAAGSGVGTRGFDTMVRISGQIRTMGRMTRGHISQLGAVGLDVNRILRDQLHLTEAQIANIAHAGIDRERLIQGLREGMRLQWGGGMERAAATLAAKLSDLQDTLGNLKRQIYVSLGPVLIPLVDAFSAFLTANAARIAAAFTLLFSVVTNVIRAIVGPVFGAFSDAMGRARTDASSALGDIGRRFLRFALIVEGLAALISGDDGRGFSRIGSQLKARLEAAGVWGFVVRLARLASLLRAVIQGVIEEIGRAASGRLATLARLFDAVTRGGDNFQVAREQAEGFGRSLVTAASAYLTFREGMAVGRWLLENLDKIQMAVSMVRTAFTFLAAHPVLLVILALAAVAYLLYRHFRGNVEVMGRLRAAWHDFKTAMEPVVATFRSIWTVMASAGRGVADTIGGAVVSVLEALRPALPLFRLIASAIAVIQYLIVLVFAGVLRAAVMAAMYPLAAIARGIGQLGAVAFPHLRRGAAVLFGYFQAGARVIQGAFQSIAPAILPYLRMLWSALRVIGSVALVVLYVGIVHLARTARVAFGVVVAVARATWRSLSGVFGSIASTLRSTFGFLEPFVGPIFNAVASLARSVFGGMIDGLLSGLRMMAGALVRTFEGLPPQLQPAALRGAIENLRAFSSGRGLTADTAPPAATDANAAARANINTSRAAPARAANATAAAATVIASGGAAPHINVQPPPAPAVNLVVDGRVLATAVQRRQDDDRVRGGGTVTRG